ncbi:DJ-1/PfpI family protein [Kitasatospora cathayae]|uniref:DJ-1/PfpI family protein n=1 Tax=Kitasatospora cathayae TaxID=3004092 RepID=A0ABY7PXQ6_9ACTN|nr:DJ-1/PfpI family protein [Kitasatospora sp. HUAS 3-15]WBP85145.1 DJ-1/PfpI family protein [Kitasatospora sp. HUAS 3-15]
MADIAVREGTLTGTRIAVLVESDYYEPEITYYRHRFAEEGAEVDLLSRLWGESQLIFTGHEFRAPLTVTRSLEGADPRRYGAIIVPSGMVADRLRYSEDVNRLAPATRLLRWALSEPGVVKGIICHGMWLASAIPQTVRGRKVVCHNNLIGDVRNMGAEYVDQDVVVDGDLVTARTGEHHHLLARTVIDLLADRRSR